MVSFAMNDLELCLTSVSRSQYFLQLHIFQNSAFYIDQLQIIHVLILQCNVPLVP